MNVQRLSGRLPGSVASFRITGKVIGVIFGVTFCIGVLFQLSGRPLIAGMTVALGMYLILCSLIFILVPLVALDVFFD